MKFVNSVSCVCTLLKSRWTFWVLILYSCQVTTCSVGRSVSERGCGLTSEEWYMKNSSDRIGNELWYTNRCCMAIYPNPELLSLKDYRGMAGIWDAKKLAVKHKLSFSVMVLLYREKIFWMSLTITISQRSILLCFGISVYKECL